MESLQTQATNNQMDQSLTSSDDYNVDELRKLVDEALTPIAPSTNVRSYSESIFSFGDTNIFSKLQEALKDHLDNSQISLVLDKLRTELYSGMKSKSISELHTIITNFKTVNNISPKLPSWNISTPDIVFITESPPFWGESDSGFVAELKRVGFSSSICAWTFLVRCHYDKTISIPDEEFKFWKQVLFSELRIWQPKLIFPVGKTVTDSFLGEGPKFREREGVIHWIGPWAILPTSSFSYATKNDKINQFRQNLTIGYDFCFGNH